jgi:phosphate transport system substrate-binding protein
MKSSRQHVISRINILAIGVIVFLCSCNRTPKKFTDETPTRGITTIAVDESYQLLAEAQLETFLSIYKDAQVKIVYLPEDKLVESFLNDSVKVILTSHKLTDNENEYLISKQIIAKTTKIAYDAIAFVVNKSNKDTLFKYNTIKGIFSGEISNWKQINPNSELNNLKVIFDKPGSNNISTIVKQFGLGNSLPAHCYTMNNSSEVISFVESHPEAIGLLSVNWISDPRDSISNSYLEKIKIVAIAPNSEDDEGEYFVPHQAYVANKQYPFIREVYAINRETFSGLGTGFTSFVAGDSGQRIILKMGMVPALMPVRVVEIKSNL